MKGIGFGQSSSPVLAATTLHMIIAISAAYYFTIGILDVANYLHNTLKASSECEIIGCPSVYYLSFNC